MRVASYYNEFDPATAEWLRELIKAKLIPDGEVDERSIEDVKPNELMGFTQCHFFAGIGGWAHALKLAKWPEDRPVWTGSCPCQPFSSAGKRKGPSDERHLWPAFHWLIKQCQPQTIFGEQVASPDGIAWLDSVSNDLENEGYAVGPIILPACSVGAPHIRQRSWFVADYSGERFQIGDRNKIHNQEEVERLKRCSDFGGMANTESIRRSGGGRTYGENWQKFIDNSELGDSESNGRRLSDKQRKENTKFIRTSETCWSRVDWLRCRDGKSRPVESGTFPLAYGVSERVGLLRGYGNAIVPPLAKEVIEAYKKFKGWDQK